MSESPAPLPFSILVVDDHALVREAFTHILKEKFPDAVVASAGSGADAMKELREQKYDLAMVDIELGDRSGLDIMAELRTLAHPPAVIAVSMHEEETFVTRTMNLGALAYVAKDAPTQELFEAITHCMQGKSYISSALARRLEEQQKAEGEASSGRLHQKLSNRELEVLIQLAQGKTLKEVARDLSLSASTVAVHKYNISRKTGLNSLVDLFKYCQTRGLV